MRRNNIGKQIVVEIIKSSNQPLYLVCIIPEYFIPFGFKIVSNYPDEIQNKLDYCNEALAVPENYVAMKHFSS